MCGGDQVLQLPDLLVKAAVVLAEPFDVMMDTVDFLAQLSPLGIDPGIQSCALGVDLVSGIIQVG